MDYKAYEKTNCLEVAEENYCQIYSIMIRAPYLTT